MRLSERRCGKKACRFSVPINQLERTIINISPYLKPGSIVYDVCSVKEQPCKWMLEQLPSSVSIIGTHPLFGPDSAGSSLKGCKIAICPVWDWDWGLGIRDWVPPSLTERSRQGMQELPRHFNQVHDRLRLLFPTELHALREEKLGFEFCQGASAICR